MHDDQLDGYPPTGAEDPQSVRTATDAPSRPALFRLTIREDTESCAAAAREASDATSARAAEDAALYEALAAAGFSGPVWNLFAETLAEYAYPVVSGWLYTGEIFALCAARGRPVRASRTFHDLEALRCDPDEREELVCEVIARALFVFRKRALGEGRWRPDGRASLKTYFIGAVLGEFSGVYDRWASERTRRPLCDPDGMEALCDAPAHPGGEPETRVIGHDAVRRLLAEVKDETTRTAVFLSLRGYTNKEIGEILDLSASAVAMRLMRLRKNPPQQSGREDG